MAADHPVPPPLRQKTATPPLIAVVPLRILVGVCAADLVVAIVSGLIKASLGRHLTQCESFMGQIATSVNAGLAHRCTGAHAGYDIAGWIFYLALILLIGLVGARVWVTLQARGGQRPSAGTDGP